MKNLFVKFYSKEIYGINFSVVKPKNFMKYILIIKFFENNTAENIDKDNIKKLLKEIKKNNLFLKKKFIHFSLSLILKKIYYVKNI